MELRNHYSKFIIDTVKTVWALIFIAVINIAGSKDINEDLDEIGMKGGIFIGLGALLIAVVIMLINMMRWRKTKNHSR